MKRTLLKDYKLFVKEQEIENVYFGGILTNFIRLHLNRNFYFILFFFFCMLGFVPVNATVYYVSNSGNDSNSGTSIATAWRSLAKVNSSTFRAGDQILLKRGDSWEGSITVKTSGTAGNPITYSAYGSGDNPKIYGSEIITEWTRYSGNIYKATVGKEVTQLFINGERASIARYPKSGYLSITSVTHTTEFISSDLPNQADGYYTGAFAVIKSRLYTLSKNTVVNSVGQGLTIDSSPSGDLNIGEGFFLYNKLDFLTEAGEWCYDRKTGNVYVWMPNNDSPDSYEVRCSLYKDGIKLDNNINYINISGLDFRHQSLNGVYMYSSKDIIVENNYIGQCSGVAIDSYYSGSRLIFRNNEISDVFERAIHINYGNDNLIEGNTINKIGRLASLGSNSVSTFNPGVAIASMFGNCSVQYNRISDCGYIGIYFNKGKCSIYRNFIDGVLMELNDGGAIYSFSADYTNGGIAGSIISENIILNVFGATEGTPGLFHLAFGVYLDYLINDVTIEDNLVGMSSGGINLNQGGRNIVSDNTFFDCLVDINSAGQKEPNIVKNNIMYKTERRGTLTALGKNTNQRFVFQSGNADSNFDDNTYIVPYTEDYVFVGYKDFKSWQEGGDDVNSFYDGTDLSDDEQEELFYNDTKATKTIDLGGYIYRDIYGKEVSGKFTLEPFTSRILIKTTKKANQTPEIKGQTFNIDGDSEKNSLVGQVVASDADADQTLSYSIVGGNNDNLFYINSSNGQIYTKEDFKYSEDASVTLLVKVTDNATSPLSAQANVVINIQGVIFPDTTPPAISSFSIPNTASSLTVSITSFVANDNTGVTGYKVTENMISSFSAVSGWDNTIPKTYTFSSFGAHTLYAWVIDAAGNISNVASASVTIYDLSPVYTSEDKVICEGESYMGWTASGEYKRTLQTSIGADSIVTTSLYVNPVIETTENISIKEGESYQGWTTSGSYQTTLTSATGCDSIVTTNLTVAETLFTDEDITICSGESYLGWTTAGQYERTLEASSGADSIVTTNLYVNPVKKVTENISIKEGESYQGWTTNGNYQRTLTSAIGCDSIVTTNLTVAETLFTAEDITICAGESYLGWTTAGPYERTLEASSGADSIVTTNLYVNPVKKVTENISIKEGESYQGWTTNGNYQRTLTSATGCDSIVTTNLTVAETLFTDEDITICSGESYLGWTTAGRYERTLEASSGADSIVTTNLYVNPVKKVTENISIKEGESYQGWTTSGSYQRTLTSATGCDSIVTTNLIVAETLFTVEDITICSGESYLGWTTAGQYERTLEASSGADSIVTTNLYVNPVKKVTENISIKEGESYQGWTTSGSYQRTLTSVTGCDSIVTTNLSVVAQAIFVKEDVTICDGESYQGWTVSGEYQRTLTASSGVDSIVTTNLFVNPVSNTTEDISIKEGESYQGWTVSGRYERTLTAATGCDSIITTNLAVIMAETLIATEDITICEGESYFGWTTAGQYERTLEASTGDDSVIITNLYVNAVAYISEEITIVEGENYEGWTQAGEYQRTLTSVTGCDSIVTTELSVEQAVIQTIELKKGWNVFSSYVFPSDSSIDAIQNMLSSSNILWEVEDENGNTYEKKGNNWINNIGNFKRTEGYKIRVKNSGVLTLKGQEVALPLNIELEKGWNLISFPYNGTVDAMEVIQPLIDAGSLVKVQDEKGNSIEYWGDTEGWINAIGNFNVGEGYFIQVRTNSTLPIMNEYEKSALVLANELATTNFRVGYEGNGSKHMNINIVGLNEIDFQVGDEIAAFDGDICVGAVKLGISNIEEDAVSIRASLSDNDVLNGFTEGNQITLVVWNAAANEVTQYVVNVIEGNLTFEAQGSVFAQFSKQETTSVDEFESVKVNMFPNPATDQVAVQFSTLPEYGTRIELIDMTGKQLVSRGVESVKEVFDIRSYISGIYFIKIISANGYKVNKLVKR